MFTPKIVLSVISMVISIITLLFTVDLGLCYHFPVVLVCQFLCLYPRKVHISHHNDVSTKAHFSRAQRFCFQEELQLTKNFLKKIKKLKIQRGYLNFNGRSKDKLNLVGQLNFRRRSSTPKDNMSSYSNRKYTELEKIEKRLQCRNNRIL